MNGNLNDWSGLKASWKGAAPHSPDAEALATLKDRVAREVRRMRLSSLMEILATVGMSCILVWFGVSRPTSLEALVIYLLAVGALAGQGVIVRMRERLSHAVADTPHALWTLKAQQARLTRKIALLGLFAGPLGVLTGYALAIVFSIPGAAAGSSMPLLAFAVIALSGGMLHAALEARRAKRDLAEALETLSLLDDAAA